MRLPVSVLANMRTTNANSTTLRNNILESDTKRWSNDRKIRAV